MRTLGKTSLERRRFFYAFSMGAAAAVASPLALEAKADSESNDEKRKSRYKESDHVKAYYRVNRYPN